MLALASPAVALVFRTSVMGGVGLEGRVCCVSQATASVAAQCWEADGGEIVCCVFPLYHLTDLRQAEDRCY